jgi:hypothetical protein
MNEAKTFRTKILKLLPCSKKKSRFCFIVAKNGSKQNIADLTGDLAGDVGANFLY